MCTIYIIVVSIYSPDPHSEFMKECMDYGYDPSWFMNPTRGMFEWSWYVKEEFAKEYDRKIKSNVISRMTEPNQNNF